MAKNKDKEVDIDEEVEKLARQTNINIRKTEYSFDHQLKRLDKDIDRVVNDKLKEFDKTKELTSEYLLTDYNNDSIERYREKLKKI